MPTGYTYRVADGEITKFSDFAMSCARAFGACISMKEEPLDAPIPEEIKPSTYHADKLPFLRARLVALHEMSDEDAQLGANADYTAELRQRGESDRDRQERNERIYAMLAAVEVWQPPTPDHKDMKKFMFEQLMMSIDKPYQRDPVAKLTGSEWRAAQIASVKQDIEYHETESAKEIERARSRTEWLKALRSSLEPQPKAA